MNRITNAMLIGLFGILVTSLASAGMMDDLMKESDKATQQVNEANTKAQEAGKTLEKEQQKANQAKEATQQDTGDFSHKLREAAKEKSNETIDSIGK